MLRILSTAIRDIALRGSVVNITSSLIPKQCPITQCIQHRFFGAFSSTINKCNDVGNTKQKPIFGKIQVDSVVSPMLVITTPARTVTKYSRRKGAYGSELLLDVIEVCGESLRETNID
ncbi:uncharacterized protein mRpL35 isoform X2 [Bombus flavifrons]|uniref:uncharacterized protein mRpL35 isoform X2 n=1 Tax=Bombus flavifrons TaxID=103934 RepID=UPI00370499AC